MAIQRKNGSGKGVAAKSGEKVPLKQDNEVFEAFVIEKGVPIPQKSERDSLVYKFPLEQMEIGDSFLVKKQSNRTIKNSLSCSIRQFCKGKGIKHKYSVLKDPNSEFIRVWRTE